MNAIELEHIYKQYTRGEKFYALRDRIPDLARKLIGLKPKEEVAKSDEFYALKDVSFTVGKGESLGIIGPNGAGKSTILKMLSRVTRQTKGRFKVEGRLSSLIEVGAGFHPDFTGRENIYFNGAVLNMKRKEIDKKFDDIVEFSGIRDFIDTPVKRYSTGMAARLGFAVAAHLEPDVLLVDEVLSVGDMQFQAKCLAKMKELFHSGVTIVFISHNTALVQALCERTILLDKGEIQKEGPSEEVIPYYERLMSQRREEDIRKEMEREGKKQKAKDHVTAEIPEVTLLNEDEEPTQDFSPDDLMKVKINYETTGPIKHPQFSFEIFRSDKILCTSLNTKNEKFTLAEIDGKGTLNLVIPKTNLGPGVYYTRAAIWDEKRIHQYVAVQKVLFRINPSDHRGFFNSIFQLPVHWEHESQTARPHEQPALAHLERTESFSESPRLQPEGPAVESSPKRS